MDARVGHLEREVKLEVRLDLDLPDLRKLAGGTVRQPEQHLDATYVDTGDFRLWERGITLRHRTGEGPAPGTWTLKLPEAATATTIDRTELSWPGAPDAAPTEVQRLLRGIVRHADLHEVVRLETIRRPLELHDRRGLPWAFLDDDTVTVRGGPHDGLRFREVEVELAEGSDRKDDRGVGDAFRKVLAALEKSGAQRRLQPKIAVALGLSAARPARHPIEVDRRSTLDVLVRRSLASSLDRLLDHDLRLRLDPSDPPVEDVHQARVATRRLRADLKTFRPALDEIWAGQTRNDLKWVGGILGRVRDLDVLAETLSTPRPGQPMEAAGRRELLGKLADQRRGASRQLVEVIDSDPRYLRLLDRLHAAATEPPFRLGRSTGRRSGRDPAPDQIARSVMPRLITTSWRSLRRTVRRAGKRPTNRQLHQIRIRSKQLRYACEIAAPVVGKRSRRTAVAAARIQRVLGDHHDAVAAEEWLWNETLGASPWAAFAAGQMTADLRRRRSRLRRRWLRAWSRLDRPAVRRWLR